MAGPDNRIHNPSPFWAEDLDPLCPGQRRRQWIGPERVSSSAAQRLAIPAPVSCAIASNLVSADTGIALHIEIVKGAGVRVAPKRADGSSPQGLVASAGRRFP